jgi:hypothetical protein
MRPDSTTGVCGLASLLAVSDPSMRMAVVPRSHCAFAALNLTISSAGTRPRSFTSMPWALAHSRSSVVLGALAGARRTVRAYRQSAAADPPAALA